MKKLSPSGREQIASHEKARFARIADAAQTETAAFDPWSELAAHRPLGGVIRARKVGCFASQQGRRH